MLSIITDLFGPIFAKEMVEMARRWRYYQNRIIFGAILLLVLYIVYQESLYSYNSRGGWTLATLSKMAEGFFLSYLWVQFLAVFLFVPFFLTGVISGEREQKTLDLLFTTQLGNREIVFGKLGSRVVSMVMLILSGIPIVSMTMLFGGVNPHTLSYAMIATAVALIYTSSMAIYFSTTTKTTIGALVRTYWWMLMWIFIVPMLLYLLVGVYEMTWGGRGSAMITGGISLYDVIAMIICLLNPVAPFFVSVNDFMGAKMKTILGEWYLLWMIIAPLLWSGLMVYLAIRNVRRDPGPSKLTKGMRSVIGGIFNVVTLKPVTSRLLKKLPQTSAERTFGFTVENPLWLRSRRAFVYDRDQHVQRAQLGGWILVILVVGLLAALDSSSFRHREAAIVFMVWIWLGLSILASLLSGLCIVNDRRRGFFEFVLVTPMTPYEVIKGTYLAVWRHIKKTYILILAMMAFFIVTGSVSFDRALASIIIGTLFVMVMVLVGIACSLTAKSVAGGLIASFAFPIMMVIFVPMFGGLFRESMVIFLWTVCIIMTPISFLLTYWRKNPMTVLMLLLFVHLSLVCLFTSWVAFFRSNEYPIMAIHPGYLTLEVLEDRRSYGGGSMDVEMWTIAKVAYCLALIINLVWLFFWICRNYEVLSGRREQGVRRGKRQEAGVA